VELEINASVHFLSFGKAGRIAARVPRVSGRCGEVFCRQVCMKEAAEVSAKEKRLTVGVASVSDRQPFFHSCETRVKRRHLNVVGGGGES
jgi:hypothetical protein